VAPQERVRWRMAATSPLALYRDDSRNAREALPVALWAHGNALDGALLEPAHVSPGALAPKVPEPPALVGSALHARATMGTGANASPAPFFRRTTRSDAGSR